MRPSRALAVGLAGALLGVLAAALVGPGAAGARQVRVESVGVVPIRDETRSAPDLRDAAEHGALGEAVLRVARDLLGAAGADVSDAALRESLGQDPLGYVDGYRRLEDRGERPALFSSEPGVEREYVVVLEVQVDEDRVRRRLAGRGWVSPSGDGGIPGFVQIGVEGDYDAYRAVRDLLVAQLGLGTALPMELTRERAVLQIATPRDPAGILDALLAAAGPDVRITPVGSGRGTLELRVRVELPPRADPVPPPGPAAHEPAIDTSGPNRY